MRRAVAALLLGCALCAQDAAAVRVVLADDPGEAGPPALVWLRREYLPKLPGWPVGLDPLQRLRIRVADTAVVATPTSQETRGYLDGEFVLPGLGSVLLSCDRTGIEDWFVPVVEPLPAGLLPLLQPLGDLRPQLARSIDAASFCGMLASAMVDDDPRRQLATLGMRECGEVTFQYWRQDQLLRVRGRSAGGLLLPTLGAVLASVAHASDLQQGLGDASSGRDEALAVRAFASRDADRAEAARQLARTRTPAAQATLRALLFTSDSSRLSAMDSLLRQDDPEQLIRILAATDAALPQSVDVARDAVAALWPRLSRAQQLAARARVMRTQPALADILPTVHAEAPVDGRGAMVALLAVLMFSLFGFWLRERMRHAAD